MLDETPAEEVVEKEINLVQAEQANPEANILTETPKAKSEPNFIPKKPVADLTDADKATIIANYQNGVNQPFYEVKQFKNGKYRILKKKESQPTVAQKVVNNSPVEKAEKKAYYTDNQLLFEHIIELNAKVDRLMTKHKKLKRKYQAMQNDIYVEDAEDESCEVGTNLGQNETKIEQKQSDISLNNEAVKQPYQTVYPQAVKKGWRSQVTFL